MMFFRRKTDPFAHEPAWKRQIHDQVLPFTMTGSARIYALIDAVEYLVEAGVPGAMVECGVWRGGSMMACAMTLRHLDIQDRDLYLFDTFSGMTQPTSNDIDLQGNPAVDLFRRLRGKGGRQGWCAASLEEVDQNMAGTGYPRERIHLVQGDVLESIPREAPERVAMLRLDTDWYESTRHELVHLFPRVASNGAVIIDDYGHWQGARKAVDEYFQENGMRFLLHRIDYTARLLVRTGGLHANSAICDD